jgi:hypothetical protein
MVILCSVFDIFLVHPFEIRYLIVASWLDCWETRLKADMLFFTDIMVDGL